MLNVAGKTLGIKRVAGKIDGSVGVSLGEGVEVVGRGYFTRFSAISPVRVCSLLEVVFRAFPVSISGLFVHTFPALPPPPSNTRLHKLHNIAANRVRSRSFIKSVFVNSLPPVVRESVSCVFYVICLSICI